MRTEIKVLEASHVDHNLTEEQLGWLLDVALRSGAYAEGYLENPHVVVLSFMLPEELGAVPCGLHGPVMGDEPVLESEVRYAVREGRLWESRLCDRPVRPTRVVTLVTGPGASEPLALYTAFGGPVAPREPGDPSLAEDHPAGVSERERARSTAFWAEHALSAGG